MSECEGCPPKKLGSFPLTREGVIKDFCEPHHALLAAKDAEIGRLRAEAVRLELVRRFLERWRMGGFNAPKWAGNQLLTLVEPEARRALKEGSP